MDVELNNKIYKLEAIRDKLVSKIERQQRKLDRLSKKTRTPRIDSKYGRMIFILGILQNQLDNLEDALQRIEDAKKTVNQLGREVGLALGTPNENTKKEEYERATELYKNLIDRTYNEYTGKNGIAVNKGFNLTKGQKILAGVSAVAILIGLYNAPSLLKKYNNGNTNPSSSNGDNNNPSGSNQPNPDKEQNKVVIPELEQEELAEIIKVEDESLIPERAQDLLGYLNIIAPDHGLTLEEVTTYLNYKNGFVNNTTQEPTQNPVETPTTGTFTDINDEEKLYERVNGVILPVFDNFAPQYGVDEAYAVNMFNYTNGGLVEDPSRDSSFDVIKMYDVLLSSESVYAVDMKNKGESLREESTSTIDYGIFFLDGSKAQTIASKISDYRRRIITAPTTEEAIKASTEFAEFFKNSWYLDGANGEISLYAIKSSGQSALLDKLFLETASLAQANQDENYQITVTGLDGEKKTLREMVEKVNEANCLATLEADNGDEFLGYVNKLSADIDGMYREALSTKNQKSEEFTFGLNYNKK